jgi:hypothetical protein
LVVAEFLHHDIVEAVGGEVLIIAGVGVFHLRREQLFPAIRA